MKLAAVVTIIFFLLPHFSAAQAPIKPVGTETGRVKPRVPPSKSVAVTFAEKMSSFTVDDLLKLPQVTVHVHNAHRDREETYSGPLLSDVLAQVDLKASRDTERLILHSSVIATGTDHYFVVYSLAEVEPTFSTGQVIVAVMKSGLPNPEGGNIQLINTVDAKPARWLHGLTNITVMSVGPVR